MNRLAPSLLTTVLSTLALAQQPQSTLTSPSTHLAISFQSQNNHLTYTVTYKNKPVLAPSTLSLTLRNQPPLGPACALLTSTATTHDSTYTPLNGKTKTARDHYNALTLDLAEPDTPDGPGRHLTLEARAYDDAVAFRYLVPEQPALKHFDLTNESTQFKFPTDATAYALELPNQRSMYESEFLKLPVSAFANRGGVDSKSLIGLPTLLHLPGTAWLAVTEADVKDYAALYLTSGQGSWAARAFDSQLAPHPDDPKLAVTGNLPHHSPWRVIMVADDPGRFIESNTISNLNPPPASDSDFSWVKPGKSAWDWWSGYIGRDGKPNQQTTDTLQYLTDFAADNNLQYVLVDAGWSPQNDITKLKGNVDIPALVQYAAQKNIKIWIWCHWSAVDRQMQDAFPLYQKWGVAGVKIDFMSRDDQPMLDWYYRTAALAAEHHLMVDFHGATKPTGIDRTWPNVMGYEAVLGMEQSKAGARDNPDSHLMLPFTRMLAGPMDYTPGGFDNVTPEQFTPRGEHPMVMGTRAHHLAMYVTYFAPFQMVSDTPHNYENQPAFQFIKDVPTTWDDTKVLQGDPGQYIVIARKKDNDWYLGAMTNGTPRALQVPLTFLDRPHYTAQTYADAEDAAQNPKHVKIESNPLTPTDTLTITLAPNGGFAAHIKPAPAP